ncbi:NfeD family protein [Aquincola sp. MAHUQ-54]|uniref:NfeD family protein n=1 Tax=Aquincola agrisoli TaxID=3119538 RepID=A0AAW9QF04_9BURK
MDWSATTVWWLAAGVLVAVELATTTFYLLMMALGTVAGALAAHMGLGVPAQIAAAAFVGGGAVAALHLLRRSRGRGTPSANRDLNLDIGEQVQVDAWHADGATRLPYRGSLWSARYIGAGDPQPGLHVIRAVEGSMLLLDRVAAR